jgi:DNA modification methylase
MKSVESVPIGSLKPYLGDARTHSRKQVKAIARSIERFGFTNPVLATSGNEILAGHGRVEAAKLLNMSTVSVLRIDHLSEDERRAYIIADNRLAEKAGWDKEILEIELQHLVSAGFDIELTGFEVPEIDLILDAAADKERDPGPEDITPALQREQAAVTRPGDLWLLGPTGGDRHRLLNGDCSDPATVATLMGADQAALVITDPPYNVAIEGHVSGNGRTRHREFAMAAGEMSEDEFVAFLHRFLAAALTRAAPTALFYVFMDWRHLYEALTAARGLGLELINLCVWNKTNGGMGSLYRSKHELVLVLGRGGDPHRNNVELGKHGRSRTNVWDYAGLNTFRSGRDAELAMHPTVKPVAMIADAIRDVTKRGDLVFDPFGGSGTILIAAEKTGRRARSTEIDPHYCDVAIRRWEAFTGKSAVLSATGETFEDVAERRRGEPTQSR